MVDWRGWLCLFVPDLVDGCVEVARNLTVLCEFGRRIGWHQHFVLDLDPRVVKRNTGVHRQDAKN